MKSNSGKDESYRWLATTLHGHIVLYGGGWSIVMIPTFLIMNYMEGTLTLKWALFIILTCPLFGILGGVFMWFFVMKPLLRRRTEGKDYF